MSSWNLIESDAGVFTELIEKFGVKGAQFEELLSIDEDSLRAVGPLYGVVFLFKYRASEVSAQYSAGKPRDGAYAEGDQGVFFAKQMIQNACATQAVLSIVLNRPELEVGEYLGNFKQFVESFDSEVKGEAISNSDVIREAHNSFSRPTPFLDDDDDRPHRNEEDDGLYHFIAYLPVNGTLLELDGLHPSPISHGPCTDDEFPHKLPEVLRRRIENNPAGELRFSLIALTKDRRQTLKEIGDAEGLAREEEKREAWQRENLLRRENFTGLINDLVRQVTGGMSDEEFENAITAGRDKTRQRIESRRS